jgi:hypothetical protein
MNFCFFFNAIGQNVLNEEALESLKKGTMKLILSRGVFSTSLFQHQCSFYNAYY